MANRVLLQVEELGQRVLPSTTTSVLPLFPLFPTVPAPLPTVSTHALAGQAQGGYIQSGLPSLLKPVTDTLHGTDDLNALGHATVNGTVHGVGLVALGRATGTLTFANVHGSVTVALTGPLQAMLSALPQQFTYTVVGGTGAYAHVRDTGSLTLTLEPAPAGTMTPSLFPTTAGTFTMTLAGGIAVRPRPQIVSGITGLAVVGPTTPLAQPGVANTAPLAGAVIDIESLAGRVLAEVTTSANGTFSVPLQPGTYRLIPLPPRSGSMLPRAVTQPIVTVYANEYSRVLVSYDSGIR